MDTIRTEQYRGIDINIHHDSCACNPRTEWEHDTTIWSNHRGYQADGKDIDDLMNELDVDEFPGSFSELCEIADKKGYFAIPVYAYIHSGIAFSLCRNGQFADRWDSGTFDIVTIPKQTVYKVWNCKRITKAVRKKLENCIIAELNEYAAYCNGEVYGYTIFADTDEEDEVWGFYGDAGLEFCIDQAKQGINYYFKKRDKEAVEFWSELDKDIA